MAIYELLKFWFPLLALLLVTIVLATLTFLLTLFANFGTISFSIINNYSP